MRKNCAMISLAIVLIALLGTACGSATRGYSGSNVGNKISASYDLFNGTRTKTISAEEGTTIVLHFSSEVKKGELTIRLLDSSGDLVADMETNTIGTREIKADRKQDYRLVIKGTDTKGSFNVSWDKD